MAATFEKTHPNQPNESSDSGFKSDFQDGSNQVRHFAAGFIAGGSRVSVYDSVNRLTTTTDPALKVTTYEYNPRSQMTAVVDAINQRYEFADDPLGRVT